jgi:hypothetical protein
MVMHQKKIMVLLAVTCINSSLAIEPDTKVRPLFSDEKHIKLDQLASAQQQLENLPQNPILTKNEIGKILALTVIGAIGLRFVLPYSEQQTAVLAAGLSTGIVLVFSKNERKEEKEKLQNFILNAKIDPDKTQEEVVPSKSIRK